MKIPITEICGLTESEEPIRAHIPDPAAPRVSVIIPTYNREALVGETIRNMLEQSLPPYEVIVVDDGSTDRSVAVIRGFGDCVRLVQQANQGPGAARNAGLRLATGDYVQFMDSDDLASRNKLEAQAAALEREGSDVVFSPWAKVSLQDGVVAFENHVLQQALPDRRVDLLNWALRGWSTVFQSLLFRASFLRATGFYRQDLQGAEDSEYFVRLLLRRPRVAFTDQCLTLYRLHSYGNLTPRGKADAQRLLEWAHYLRRACESCEETGWRADHVTSWMAWATIHTSLRELQAAGVVRHPNIAELGRRVPRRARPFLPLIPFSQRVLAHLRWRLRGSRWIPAYHASLPSRYQLDLIRDLGFTVNQRPRTQE